MSAISGILLFCASSIALSKSSSHLFALINSISSSTTLCRLTMVPCSFRLGAALAALRHKNRDEVGSSIRDRLLCDAAERHRRLEQRGQKISGVILKSGLEAN